jgi:hypothetical protein
MAIKTDQLQQIAQDALDRQEAELNALRAAEARAVVVTRFTGTGHIDKRFALDRVFRFIFLRCHFTGTTGTNPLYISVDSTAGSAHDTRLFTVSQAGADFDINLRMEASETTDPSAWIFRAGDELRVEWTNPDTGNITWGIEVGLALGS